MQKVHGAELHARRVLDHNLGKTEVAARKDKAPQGAVNGNAHAFVVIAVVKRAADGRAVRVVDRFFRLRTGKPPAEKSKKFAKPS